MFSCQAKRLLTAALDVRFAPSISRVYDWRSRVEFVVGVATNLGVPQQNLQQMGSRGGRVAPHDAIRGAGKATYMQTTIAPPAGMSRQTSAQFAADVARELRVADSRHN